MTTHALSDPQCATKLASRLQFALEKGWGRLSGRKCEMQPRDLRVAWEKTSGRECEMRVLKVDLEVLEREWWDGKVK